MIPSFFKDFYKRYDLRPFQPIWLLYVHMLGVVGLFNAIYFYSNKITAIILVHCCFWLAYGIGITGGAHRLWAHKAYSAALPVRIILMLWNAGANQGSIFHWSRDHRLHHKFSDTPLDPHNIKRGFFYSHVGWLLQKKSPQLVEEGKKIDMTDLLKDKVVMFQKKHYIPLSLFMCIILPTITYHYIAETSIATSFCLSFFTYMWILNATWFVNSICHMFGSRPWNKNIEPRDNYLVSFLTHGEGYHNWHHEYPSDWRGSKNQWYMFNITTRFIEIMKLLGMAWVKS